MNTAAILEFLNDPAHGWDSRRVGKFIRHVWPRSEPPRWKTGTDALREGSSRAFLGNLPPPVLKQIDRALAAVEDFFRGAGLLQAGSEVCHVILWDRIFPLPKEWELPPLPEPPCPVAIPPADASSPAVILLPTHDLGRFGGHDRAWLESSAIHEGFHALLSRWLGKPCVTFGWEKFEEMCAVAMEARLLRKGKAWMDYGRFWQGSLSLSHCHSSWSATRDLQGGGDFIGAVDREDYGHFALIAFLDQHVWPRRERGRHWIAAVWDAVRAHRADDGPWAALHGELKEEGGVPGLFLEYVREAAFPERSDSVMAELHRIFGPPAAAALERGEGRKVFALGPMAAQLLSCRVAQRTTGDVVEIVDRFRRLETTVLAFRVSKQGRQRRGIPVDVPPAEIRARAKVWQIPIQNGGREATEYVFVVSQPSHNGRSLAFTAEWR